MARMHADELDLDEALVRRLLAGRFPEWAGLPVSRVAPDGTVNSGRGIPLAARDESVRNWLERFDGDPAVVAEWGRALGAPPWDGPPVWHHGDLDVRNWLVRDGRIRGVIDWGELGVGDPPAR